MADINDKYKKPGYENDPDFLRIQNQINSQRQILPTYVQNPDNTESKSEVSDVDTKSTSDATSVSNSQTVNQIEAQTNELENKIKNKKKQEKKKAKIEKAKLKALKKKKIKTIIFLGELAFILFLFLVIVLFVTLRNAGSTTGNIDYIKYMAYKVGLELGNEEDFEYYWSENEKDNTQEDIDYTKRLLKAQENFVNRFKSVYAGYENTIFHPDLNINELRASQMHVISTMIYDYTPEGFAGDISESSVHNCSGEDCDDDIYNEIKAYDICGEIGSENYTSLGCNDLFNDNASYQKNSLLSVLRNLFADFTNYKLEKDSIRLLARNTIIYKGTCTVKETIKTIVDGKTEYVDTIVETIEYEPFGFKELLSYVLGLDENNNMWKDKKDCNSYTSGNKIGYYDIVEDIDMCYYYDNLISTDYLDNHAHFKADIEKIKEENPNNYSEKITSYKKAIVEDIIKVVYYSMDEAENKQTIIDGSTLSYNDFTLSDSIYITVRPNAKKGTSGGSYPLDQYVEGVIEAEVAVFYSKTKNGWATRDALKETWKTMAVAIRSYVLQATKGGRDPISNSSGAQNFSSSILTSNSERAVLARTAVAETQGQVLMQNGRFFSAQYDSFYKEKTGGVNSIGGYHCDDSFCYTTYFKKGSSPAEYHVVKVPATWKGSLVSGHGQGMSQWGAFYLSTLGYNYLAILGYFYGNQVSLSGFDYGSSNTNVTNPTQTVMPPPSVTSDEYTIGKDPGSYAGENVLLCPTYNYEIPAVTLKKSSLNGYYDANGDYHDVLPITDPSSSISPENLGNIVTTAGQFVGQTATQMSKFISVSDSWCARFVSYVYKLTMGDTAPYDSDSVSSWASHFVSIGKFYTTPYWQNINPMFSQITPQAGDIIMFVSTSDNCGEKNYKGDGNLPSRSACFRHIGIVKSVSGDVVTYIHGNTGTCGLSEKCVNVSTTNIRTSAYAIGFGRF